MKVSIKMCQGQYDILDPRCINFSLVGFKCFWCSRMLDKENWNKLEEMAEHETHCFMYLYATDIVRRI